MRRGYGTIGGQHSRLNAFEDDLQSLLLIRSLRYLEGVFDHVDLGALGFLERVLPPRLSGFLDREYEVVLWVKFAKVFFN